MKNLIRSIATVALCLSFGPCAHADMAIGESVTFQTNVTFNVPPTGIPQGVASFNSRTGAVVSATSDYDASQVDNDSGVTGATVAAALDQLDSEKAGLADSPIFSSAVTFNAGATVDNGLVVSAPGTLTIPQSSDPSHAVNRGELDTDLATKANNSGIKTITGGTTFSDIVEVQSTLIGLGGVNLNAEGTINLTASSPDIALTTTASGGDVNLVTAANGEVNMSVDDGAQTITLNTAGRLTNLSAGVDPTDAAVVSQVTAKEDALGNPATSGFILSSTDAGVRSWIAAPSGGVAEGDTPTWTGLHTFKGPYTEFAHPTSDNVDLVFSGDTDNDYHSMNFTVDTDAETITLAGDDGDVQLKGVRDPTDPQDAATMSWVQANAGGGAPSIPVVLTNEVSDPAVFRLPAVLSDDLLGGAGDFSSTNGWEFSDRYEIADGVLKSVQGSSPYYIEYDLAAAGIDSDLRRLSTPIPWVIEFDYVTNIVAGAADNRINVSVTFADANDEEFGTAPAGYSISSTKEPYYVRSPTEKYYEYESQILVTGVNTTGTYRLVLQVYDYYAQYAGTMEKIRVRFDQTGSGAPGMEDHFDNLRVYRGYPERDVSAQDMHTWVRGSGESASILGNGDDNIRDAVFPLFMRGGASVSPHTDGRYAIPRFDAPTRVTLSYVVTTFSETNPAGINMPITGNWLKGYFTDIGLPGDFSNQKVDSLVVNSNVTYGALVSTNEAQIFDGLLLNPVDNNVGNDPIFNGDTGYFEGEAVNGYLKFDYDNYQYHIYMPDAASVKVPLKEDGASEGAFYTIRFRVNSVTGFDTVRWDGSDNLDTDLEFSTDLVSWDYEKTFSPNVGVWQTVYVRKESGGSATTTEFALEPAMYMDDGSDESGDVGEMEFEVLAPLGQISSSITPTDTALDITATDSGVRLNAVLTLKGQDEPADPVDGENVIWRSNGTGFGDDGDIIIKARSGATVKTVTWFDFSAAVDEDP